MQSSLAIVFLCALTAAVLPAQDPVLVTDINTNGIPTHSDPSPGTFGFFAVQERRFQVMGTQAFVVADEGTGFGRELYVVDAYTRRKMLLKDIRPGTASSWPADLAVINNMVWFSADDGTSGRELWVSDGTPGGTRRVVDLAPGLLDSFPREFTACGNLVVFAAEIPTVGRELFVSDGTAGGTKLVKDFMPPGFFQGAPSEFLSDPSGPRAYFAATSPTQGRELWITDGTTAGTRIVADLAPGAAGSAPGSLIPFGNEIVFVANGARLYRSTGSTTTEVAKFGAVNGLIVTPTTPVPTIVVADGKQIVTSDGTLAGTKLLLDLSREVGLKYITRLTSISGSTFAFFTHLVVGQVGTTAFDLWFSDGTTAGSRKVSRDTGFRDLRNTLAIGSSLFFTLVPNNASEPVRLRVSDGTPAGTQIVPGRLGLDPVDPLYLTRISTAHVLFAGDDAQLGKELFVAGTAGVLWAIDLRPPLGPNQGSYPNYKTALGDRLLFAADDGVHGRELWVHDTTQNKTQLVEDLLAGPVGSDPRYLVRLGDQVLFSAAINSNERELWITDGTKAGTKVVADLNGTQSTNPKFSTRIGRLVYFGGGAFTQDLWVTDGTLQGTKLVLDLPNPGDPTDFVPLDSGKFVFSATVGGRHTGIWVSDGTAQGTKPITNPTPGPLGVLMMRRVGDHVLYDAMFPGFGRELGITDGTVAGTRMLVDLYPGAESGSPFEMAAHGDGAWFLGVNQGYQPSLYWTDGTANGTVVRSLTSESLWGTKFASAGSRRFLMPHVTKGRGGELWISDGTKAGTRALKEVRPGPEGCNPADFVELGGSVYFTADDGQRGYELWRVPIGAVSMRVGEACTTRNQAPDLALDDAVLGKVVGVRVRNAAPASVMVLGFGLRAGQVVWPFHPSCVSYVDVRKPFEMIPIVLSANSWTGSFGLPNDSRLKGVALAWQSYFVGGALKGFEASNGVHMTIDDR